MQPIYVTQSSSGSSPWKLANWQCTPQQFSWAAISTGGSNWQIDVTAEDPTGVYLNPNSTTPTTFQAITASSTTSANQWVTLGTSATFPIGPPIAAWRLTVNTPSSAGAKVTLVGLQSGIG